MQISKSTLALLKNFAMINGRILIEPGCNLTVAAQSGILARATVSERFPVQIGIYDLNRFLSVVSLFRAPDFDFQDSFMSIRETNGYGEVRLCYAAPACLGLKPPSKTPAFPAHYIEFQLPDVKWTGLQKAASVLGKTEIRVLSDGRAISMTTYDSKRPYGDEYSVPLEGKTHGLSCNAVFQMSNLKLLTGSYHAAVTPKYSIFWNASGHDLAYWVAADPQSTFE